MSDNESASNASKIHSTTVHDFHTFSLAELAEATNTFRPVPPETPRKFHLDKCLEAVPKGMPVPPGENVYPRWDYDPWTSGWLSKFGSLSREEAIFWFKAATSRIRLTDAQPGEATINQLKSLDLSAPFSAEQAQEELAQFYAAVSTASVAWYAAEIGWVSQCLRELFGLAETARIVGEAVPVSNRYSHVDNFGPPYTGPEGEAEELKLLEVVGAQVAALKLDDYYGMNLAQKLLHRAPHQGQIRRILDSVVGAKTSRYGYHEQIFDIIYALDTADEYFHYFSRYDATITPREVRRLVARTGFEHIPWLLDHALKHGRSWSKSTVLPAILQLHSSTMAPTMLDLSLASSLSASRELAKPAEQWLLEEGANAVAGLLPLAISRGKMREPALNMLRRIRDRGHGDLVNAEIERMPEKARAGLRAALAPATAEAVQEADISDWPSWIKTLKRVDVDVDFLKDDNLPRLKTTDGKLAPLEINHALLSRLSLEDMPETGRNYVRSARLTELLSRIDPESGADYAVALLEAFYKAHEPKDQKWVFHIIPCFPAERVILAVEPHLRSLSFRIHKQSSIELAMLRIAATDDAITLIASLAHSHQDDGTRKAALKLLEEIEKERDLDEESLLDEFVPHCSLDSASSFGFDYGAHKYRLVVRGVGEWTVVDQAGHLLKSLPTPRNEDDLSKVDLARAQYRQLVAHLSRTFNTQVSRFEKAMVDGRVWHAETWRKNILAHPVLTHFARSLVWGVLGEGGAITATFRATEDGSLTDHEDSSFTLAADAEISVVHPLHLADAVRAAWAQQLSDYKVVQPFAQVGRPLFKYGDGATPGSRTHEMDSELLVRAMTDSGWELLKSASWRFTLLRKYFSRHGHGAEVTIDPGVGSTSGKGYGNQKVSTVKFFKGEPARNSAADAEVKFGDVPAVVFSEIQTDLQRALESGATK
ncbi:MAG: DUF4132 domain-containing protein [Polyangiaceae bacterium]